jgi:hypothetical protein
VVSGYGMDDRLGSAQPPSNIGSNQRVRALDLVVHRLADVVKQRRSLGDADISAQLGSHMGRQQSAFKRVLQDILAEARAILQPAQQLDQIRVQALDIRFVGDALAFFAHDALDLLLGFRDHFLDSSRMDATIFE